MTTAMERAVQRAARAWNRALLVALLGEGLGGAFAGAGVIVLVGRVFGLETAWPAAWAALGAACGWAAWRAARGWVGETQMATLLDLRLGGKGDVLEALEQGAPADLPCRLSELTRPRPDGRRLASVVLPGALFFGLSLLVPLRHPPMHAVDPLAATRLSELRELALALDETLEFDEALRDEVAANLDSAEAGARDEELSGEALHEALDQVEQLLERRASTAADQLDMARADLARAAAGATSDDPGESADALSELGDLAEELEALGALPPGLTAAELSEMSPGELASTLSEAAAAKLAQLAERGLLNSSQLAAMAAGPPPTFNPLKPLPGDPGRGSGSCPGGSACAGGGEGAGEGTGAACALHGGGARPGRGGVTRGPGSVPLTWGAETPDLAAELEVKALPAPRSLDDAMAVLATARSAPDAQPLPEGVRAGAPGTATSGDATYHRRLKPTHRAVVREFFGSDEQDPR